MALMGSIWIIPRISNWFLNWFIAWVFSNTGFSINYPNVNLGELDAGNFALDNYGIQQLEALYALASFLLI